MGIPIDYSEHLAFMNSNERERAAIERLIVGEFMRSSGSLACKLGLHYYCHSLVVDVPWHTFVNDRKRHQGDVDLALIPTAVNSVEDNVYELSYDFDNLVLVEVKTSVSRGNKIQSRKTDERHLKRWLKQIAKYYSAGFFRTVMLQIVIGEPRFYTDEYNNKMEGIHAWGASSYYPGMAGQLELDEAAELRGELEVEHLVMCVGTIPGLHESGSNCIEWRGPITHKVVKLPLVDNLKEQLVRKLELVLPRAWGHPTLTFPPPLPVVRVCAE